MNRSRKTALTASDDGRRRRALLVLFVGTSFLSASLLFLVQPMMTKMLLPRLGGTPAVWNTAMMFFQFLLLAGYLYADVATKRLGVKRSAWLHVALMLSATAVLPLTIDEEWLPPTEVNPISWQLRVLLAVVGWPFFVVSASAPLLQRWFSASGHRAANDPYFLYAASNAGSLLALLSYPVVFERWFDIAEQSAAWCGGYAALAVLTTACALSIRHRGASFDEVSGKKIAGSQCVGERSERPSQLVIGPVRLMRWILLAFAPSSLMLSVTTYITTDLFVTPLLWVIPLAVYLLTFVLAFARRQLVSQRLMRRLMPIAVIVVVMVLVSEATEPQFVIAAAHLITLFLIAMVCHGDLARFRPPAEQLTTFYVMIAVGGLLGGVFNALIAPLVFTVLAEYPVTIVVACWLAEPVAGAGIIAQHDNPQTVPSTRPTGPKISLQYDLVPAMLVGIGTAVLMLIANHLKVPPGPMRLALLAGMPVVVCFLLSRRMARFGLAVGGVFLVASMGNSHRGDVLETERTFFGVHRVTRIDHDRGCRKVAYHSLFHGTTLHGQQSVDPKTGLPTNPEIPLAYYHRASPIGQVFHGIQRPGVKQQVGVIGLGVGALAAYAEAGDRYTYFEIDPTVLRVAQEPIYFTYVAAARERGARIETICGDARRTLARRKEQEFDLLVADAFSSDSIPAHLLTREAMELYISRLREGGVLAVHISNRYLDLEPVVANIAADLGCACYVQHDLSLDHREILETGQQNSSWIVIARHSRDLRPWRDRPTIATWSKARCDPSQRTWTDRYTNILRAMLW